MTVSKWEIRRPRLLLGTAVIVLMVFSAFERLEVVEAFASPVTMKQDNYMSPVKSSVGALSSTRTRASGRSEIFQPKAALVTSDPGTMKSPSIRARVRDFFLSQRRKTHKPAVVEVEDVDVLKYMLGREQDDSYIALMFHAPFCKACQASLPMFERLARKYNRGRRKAPVKFLSVSVTQNNSDMLQEAFGVTKFPLARIYHPAEGLIDERPVLKKLFKDFEQRLQSVVSKGKKAD
mmetsp:Transcript_7547/g.11936  ORF Transcript_7547/g.11936 Transcript_7547/m.11936 type:complete len:235 (+) Transcript_7547:104-808(+)